MFRKMLAVLALTLATVAVASPAMAVAWGPLTSTYNGQVRVSGSGDFYKSSTSAQATSKLIIVDKQNDGNNVYGRTTFSYYYATTLQEQPKWNVRSVQTTPEHSGLNVSRTRYLYNNLYAQSSQARGTHQACAQMGFPVPDSCSSNAITTFSY